MKLSVIVPVYNLESVVAATLDSLLNVDFPYGYEIVVVNDGSDDRSREIIEAYRAQTDTIRLLNIANGGVSNARNVGLEQAKGEYITFVDGDDAVEKSFFQTAVREMDEGRYDFVQANLRIVTGQKIEYIQFNPADETVSDKERMLERFFGPNKTVSNSVCGKVFRADLLRGKAFDSSLRIAEDQKFVFDAILSSERIRLMKTVGYDYFQREGSAMHSLDRARAADILSVLGYCRDRVGAEGIRRLIDTDRMDILFFMYHDTLESGGDCTQILREIAGMDHGQLKNAMSKKARLKLTMLRRCRPLYDLIYKGNCFLERRTKRPAG